MAGPLVGIRVLDLGRFIACPFCGMLGYSLEDLTRLSEEGII